MIAALTRLPRWTKIGLAAVVVLYVALAVYQGFTLRIAGAADSYAHLDYVWQLWKGHLPDGIGYELQGRRAPSETARHLTAAHPPLFYLILVPLIGPILATGNWELATAVARYFDGALGLMILLLLAWAAWRLGGRLRNQLVVVVPAFGVLIVPFIRIAADNYNDVLLVVFSTIALTLSCLLVKEGPNVRYQVIIVVVSLLGMSTRATYIVTLGVAMLAILAAYLIHRGTATVASRLTRTLGWWSATSVIIIAGIGWFYVRNYQASGSWFRSRPAAAVKDREYKSLLDNITNIDFYSVVPSRLLGFRQWDGFLPINIWLSTAISAVCVIGLVVWLRRRKPRVLPLGARAARDPRRTVILLLLALQLLGLYAMQLQHAIGWGNINPRYFLPGLFLFAFILGIGSLAWPRLRGQLAAVLIGIFAISGMFDTIWYNSRFGDSTSAPLVLGIGAIAAGCCVAIALALWNLTRATPELPTGPAILPVELVR